MADSDRSTSAELQEVVRRTKKFLAKQLGITEEELERRLGRMGEEASELVEGVAEGVKKAWEDLKRAPSKPDSEGDE